MYGEEFKLTRDDFIHVHNVFYKNSAKVKEAVSERNTGIKQEVTIGMLCSHQ